MRLRHFFDFYRNSWVGAVVATVAVLAVIPAGPSLAQDQQQPASADSVARLTQRLIDMEAVMTDLTGKVEELQHQNQLLQQRVQQMQQDNDFRFGRVEQATGIASASAPAAANTPAAPVVAAAMPAAGGNTVPVTPISGTAPAAGGAAGAQMPVAAATPLGQPVPPTIPAGANRATATQNGYAPASGALGYLPNSQAGAAPSGTASASAAPPAPAAATADSTAANATAAGAAVPKPAANAPPEQLYNYAFNLLRQSQYAPAEAGFKEFLAKYPKNDLASNAQYWLGQSFVVRGDYKQAEVALLDGYRHYPKGAKAPDTLYLLGFSAGKLGQTKEACAAFKRFGTEYPTAPDVLKRKVTAEKQQLACAG